MYFRIRFIVCECLVLQAFVMALLQLLLLTSFFDAVNTVSLGAYGKVNSPVALPCNFCVDKTC